MATPASAAAAATKQFSYTCTGGPFTFGNEPISVGLSAPDSVAAGGTFDLTVSLPALTLATAPTASTTVQANLTLTATGGTADAGAKTGATVTSGSTNVPAGNVTYRITATTGTTTKVSVDPGTLTLALASATGTTTSCTTTSTEVLDVTIGTGGGTGDDIVAYDCTLPSGGTDTNYPADVDIKVVLTPPTSASANADASITWAGTIQTTGDPLSAPTGFPTGAKLFATIKASGAGAPATATGEATLTGVTAGSEITTLPSVTVKVKPTTTGTVTLTAGDLTFGTSSTSPAIRCTAPTTGLKAYTFTVTNGSTSPSPTPSATTTTPRPTTTRTATVTVTPSSSTSTTRSSETPKAGADTGAGGMMGPDGRVFILTGTALVAAAAVGGLVIRRRSIKG
ncbi:hypothetical protein [Nonomuraea antimicrobica]|uniref:hypothetical protein n=1 Tax=Nonomuraea antimicrobica TaxID=561173 RepID=UPI0031EDEC6B